MQTKPDGVYNWIGHIVDHFSKFHVLFPLTRKTAVETAGKLVERFLSIFGLPNIIHSDNGTEFVNGVMDAVALLWPGDTTFVHGNPGHSQSQGLVEQGNNTVQVMRKRQWYMFVGKVAARNSM